MENIFVLGPKSALRGCKLNFFKISTPPPSGPYGIKKDIRSKLSGNINSKTFSLGSPAVRGKKKAEIKYNILGYKLQKIFLGGIWSKCIRYTPALKCIFLRYKLQICSWERGLLSGERKKEENCIKRGKGLKNATLYAQHIEGGGTICTTYSAPPPLS